MSDSLSYWLQLREPADVAARSEPLTRRLADTLPRGEPICAIDLATGSGSNIRYLAERLQGTQRWLAIDESGDLLADLMERMRVWGTTRGYDVRLGTNGCHVTGETLDCHVETLRMDLGTPTDRVLFSGRQLVTASALLDLVSESWLRTVAMQCRTEGASALFTITYNGRSSCTPIEPEDDLVLELFNRHQRTDKRLGGRAAGPDATAIADRCFADAGFHVERVPSDWTLAPAEREMQRMLVDGWAHAASEIAPESGATIADWRRRRLGHIEAGASHIVVGHDDLAAWTTAI